MIQKVRLYPLLFLIFAFQAAWAQKTQVYDSLIRLKGNVYQAQFNYYLVDGDTLHHGPFSLTKQIEETEEVNEFHFSAISGNFKKDIADGFWTIRQGSFSPLGKGAFQNYTYAFKIDGKEFIAKGRIDNGIKNSPWEIYEWNIENSHVRDTIFSAQLPFKNNSMNGNFSLFHQGDYLEGYIDNSRFADKKWSFFVTDQNGKKVLLKEWVFSNNQLVNKVLYENGKALILDIGEPAGEGTALEEIPLNENYLQILDLRASINNPELFQRYKDREKVSDLFLMVVQKFQVVDSTFLPITEIKMSPSIKSKIKKFPYTKEEISLLDQVKRTTDAADSIIHNIKEDPQINLAKLSINEVALYTSTLGTLHNQLLQANKEIVQHYRNGNLQYVDREKYISNNINSSNQIEVLTAFNNDTTSSSYLLNHIQIDKTKEPIQQLISLSEGILREVEVLRDSIEIYVKEIKQEENLVQIEAALFKKYELVKDLNDSIINEQHQNLAAFDVKAVLDDFADQLLKDYSSLQSTEEKVRQVEPTLECLNNMESLLYSLQTAPENSYIVRDAFTNRVFNPYTYTEMEEKVKQPIYKSYSEIILPGIFQNLRRLNCNNIKAYGDNFDRVFTEMINILKRDTRREERRIRRTKDASRAAEILNFNLNF